MSKTIRVRFPQKVEKRFNQAVYEMQGAGKKAVRTQVQAASGPSLFDVESKVTIFQGNADYDPKLGQEVPLTKFIQRCIRFEDLVEVRPEEAIIVEPETVPEWIIDYSGIADKALLISKAGSDKALEAKVLSSTDGETPRHTLETYGIVQGQDFWPTPEATDFFAE